MGFSAREPRRCGGTSSLLAICCVLGCGMGLRPAALPGPAAAEVFRADALNRGREHYSAWFADSDGQTLYFGLSPFWELFWRSGGDPRADLEEPGDHLIGRFDLTTERFLSPLRVRHASPRSRSSVWDVLAHSNGRVYYTTYYEEMGCVDPLSGATRAFPGLGSGLNELTEGPGGNIYVTRYASSPGPAGERYGAILIVAPGGELIREIRIPSAPGAFTAPKSIAVDPQTGEIWLNADRFLASGGVGHETLHLAADGTVIERLSGSPELHFVRFDPDGRAWFAEDADGMLRLRVSLDGREVGRASLGLRAPLDFVQDIHFSADGTAVLAFWSGRIFLARQEAGRLSTTALRFGLPRECRPPGGRSVLYSAFATDRWIYATLFCGPTVLRMPRPVRR